MIMENIKIAAVGDKESVMIFNTAGVSTSYVSTPKEAEKAVLEFIRKGANVIFITEVFIRELGDLVEKYRQSAYPSLIPIPDRSGSLGLAEKKVIDNMEKAIGTNIFDK